MRCRCVAARLGRPTHGYSSAAARSYASRAGRLLEFAVPRALVWPPVWPPLCWSGGKVFLSFRVDKFSLAEYPSLIPLVCGSGGGCEVARRGADLVAAWWSVATMVGRRAKLRVAGRGGAAAVADGGAVAAVACVGDLDCGVAGAVVLAAVTQVVAAVAYVGDLDCEVVAGAAVPATLTSWWRPQCQGGRRSR